jgi:FMN phosphatase YigB (HAD superfamily)
MSKPSIQLVVTDLDNTLYDWVTFFATAFYEMVHVAVPTLNVSEDSLLDELREIHRRHHNSEHPFALLETTIVQARFPGASRAELARELNVAFHAFNRARDLALKLYPGVRQTLERFRSANVPVVAHTEATVPNALYRLKKLSVDDFFLRLYAIEPSGLGHYDPVRERELLETHIAIRYLRQDERKPDPQVLLDICNDMKIAPERTLYVGDSIARDIGMARAAGVKSAWAEYGTRFDPSMWVRLVRVTHWTDEDVKRAEEAKRMFGHVRPDATLSTSIEELFDTFSFEPQVNSQ